MPLHRLPFSFADYCSFFTASLYFYQPFVDRGAVVQWMQDNVFGSRRTFAIWGIFFGHKLTEWTMLGFYTLMYKLKLPYFEKHRAFPHKPWPWDSDNPKVREEARDLRWRAFTYIVKFHFVVFCVNYLLGTGFPDENTPQPNYARKTVPAWYTTMWQCLAGSVIAETGFYWGHRVLHKPWLYWAHKRHHEFKDCTVWATFYVSPLDALITDIIPAGAPLLIFDMHIYTIWMYTIPLILNACWVHCGYELPLRFNPLNFLPLATESEVMHDVHHRNSRYNFGGAYFLWDRMMGTYRQPPPLTVKATDTDQQQVQRNEIIQSIETDDKSD